jgi:inner membrane protein involved in colicin E2 resistance
MNSCHTTLKASYFYASAFMAVAVGNIFLPIWINNLGIVKTINLGLFVQMVALYGVLFSLSSSDPPPSNQHVGLFVQMVALCVVLVLSTSLCSSSCC